jgi:hypothetical protein
MMFKCLAVMAALAVGASALTADQHLAEVAKLEAQLHEAKARHGRNTGKMPAVKVNEGSMKFVVADGKRVGYTIGKTETMFDDLAKTDTVMAERVSAAYKSGMTDGEMGAKVQCGVVANLEASVAGKLDSMVKPLSEKIKAAEEQLKTVEVKVQVAAASDPIYWFDTAMYADEKPGETFVSPAESMPLQLTGVGFGKRFHPEAVGQMVCTFSRKDTKKTSTSVGSIKAAAVHGQVYYHVECPTPLLPKGTKVTVSLAEHGQGGKAGKDISFVGCSTCNEFVVDANHFETKMKGNYPKAPTYQATGKFNQGKMYTCEFKGTKGAFKRTVQAKSGSEIDCGAGPTYTISDINNQEGKAKLRIYSGSDMLNPRSMTTQDIVYFVCDRSSAGERDCVSGCSTDGKGGQMLWDKPGSYSWTAKTCGSVSVVAVGGGSGGGYQWSSGGGGGGGTGWIRAFEVKKGQSYRVVVGNQGNCISNAGNTHSSDGGTSYFVNTNTVAGYGGGKGGPNAASSSPGYGGGYKGDGGGRGGRGGDAVGCHHNNRNCDAPRGSGGGGGGGYYSSTWGTPAGGGVGLNGWTSQDGRGDWQQGSTGGSGGKSGVAGEPLVNGRGRCIIHGGSAGGGGGGSGSHHNAGGGKGGAGAVRIIWGPSKRVYPEGGANV